MNSLNIGERTKYQVLLNQYTYNNKLNEYGSDKVFPQLQTLIVKKLL